MIQRFLMFDFHSCEININVLFLYNGLLALFDQCTATEQFFIRTHKTIQILKIEGTSNNEARDCILQYFCTLWYPRKLKHIFWNDYQAVF